MRFEPLMMPTPIRHTPHHVSVARPRGFERPVSLSEVLDRVLAKGAVVAGEVVISVAGIELVYLGLNLVLTSVETARRNKASTWAALEGSPIPAEPVDDEG
jgi:hypothetical protein